MISRTIVITGVLPHRTLVEVVGRLPLGTVLYAPRDTLQSSNQWNRVQRCVNGVVSQYVDTALGGLPTIDDNASNVTVYKLVDLLTNALYPAEAKP